MLFKYIKRFLTFALLIALILVILGFTPEFKSAMSFAWICYSVFSVFSIVMYGFAIQTMKGSFRNFMTMYFTGIFAKLFIAAFIVIIYKLNHKDTASAYYIVPFAIIYFSFLFFETIELVKLSKATKPVKPGEGPVKDKK